MKLNLKLNKTLLIFILVILYVLYFVYLHFLAINDKSLRFKIFNVGQGDAILITTPNKKRILVDGGPDYRIDQYLSKEMFLQRCNLEVVILTHPHLDHLAGLNRIMERCKVGTVFANNIDYESQEYEKWKFNLSNLDVKPLYKGQSFYLDGATFKILWPDKYYLETDGVENINNVSIVLFVDYAEFEALLLGDAEKEALSNINREVVKSILDGRLELLKVSHHGSDNGLDKDLFSFLKPRMSVISVGDRNEYGHPDKEVVDFLKSINSKVYRTDLDGTIVVSSN